MDKAPQTATSGIVISGAEGSENVRAGVRIVAAGINDNYEIKAEGLLPNTTYHYTAYLDLGNGTVYGEDRTFTTTLLTSILIQTSLTWVFLPSGPSIM